MIQKDIVNAKSIKIVYLVQLMEYANKENLLAMMDLREWVKDSIYM